MAQNATSYKLFYFNHFGKYMKIRDKYMKKVHFWGKVQILTFFENVIKIAAVTLKIYIESRVRARIERHLKLEHNQ